MVLSLRLRKEGEGGGGGGEEEEKEEEGKGGEERRKEKEEEDMRTIKNQVNENEKLRVYSCLMIKKFHLYTSMVNMEREGDGGG